MNKYYEYIEQFKGVSIKELLYKYQVYLNVETYMSKKIKYAYKYNRTFQSNKIELKRLQLKMKILR